MNINLGLLSLKECITSLIHKREHVPYMQDKLTQLLQVETRVSLDHLNVLTYGTVLLLCWTMCYQNICCPTPTSEGFSDLTTF